MTARAFPLSPARVERFRHDLLRWYDVQRRDLPWRADRDPYRVWVSEIMLQQTRVAAVLDHYARFMQRFPTVSGLAAAREASVLALWSGLGYYHRARRMHQAAKEIMLERKGRFPQTAEECLQLPGIGRYTAAAVASICFGEPVAVVDGNVERVLSRLSGASTGREEAWQRAQACLDKDRPGDFNQAMMELGATICTPRAPQCLLCPVHDFCRSRGAESRSPQPQRKRRELHYAFVQKNAAVLLVRRPEESSLMAGMWELPLLDANLANGDEPLLRVRHSITDTDYRVAVFSVLAEQLPKVEAHWFMAKQCERLPLTGLARKILRLLRPESKNKAAVSKHRKN